MAGGGVSDRLWHTSVASTLTDPGSSRTWCRPGACRRSVLRRGLGRASACWFDVRRQVRWRRTALLGEVLAVAGSEEFDGDTLEKQESVRGRRGAVHRGWTDHGCDSSTERRRTSTGVRGRRWRTGQQLREGDLSMSEGERILIRFDVRRGQTHWILHAFAST